MAPILFSDRYNEIIEEGGEAAQNFLYNDITYTIKENIIDILKYYDQPVKYKPNRYKPILREEGVLELAIEDYEHKCKFMYYTETLINMIPYELFDIIELQYNKYIDDNEKREFQSALNSMFEENNVPWLLHDGQMIKVDSKQFEIDVKRRALEKMRLLSDSESIFQSAYDELINATEFFQKGNYAEAIINAGKSYESILKIICNENSSSASQLIQKLISEEKLISPSEKQEEFKEKVLSSLPFIRNNYAAHGAGKDTETISPSLANLAINLAATLDSYLIEEYKQKLIREDDSESISEQN